MSDILRYGSMLYTDNATGKRKLALRGESTEDWDEASISRGKRLGAFEPDTPAVEPPAAGMVTHDELVTWFRDTTPNTKKTIELMKCATSARAVLDAELEVNGEIRKSVARAAAGILGDSTQS